MLLGKGPFSPPTPSTHSCLPGEDEAACPTTREVGPIRAGQGDQEDLIRAEKQK